MTKPEVSADSKRDHSEAVMAHCCYLQKWSSSLPLDSFPETISSAGQIQICRKMEKHSLGINQLTFWSSWPNFWVSLYGMPRFCGGLSLIPPRWPLPDLQSFISHDAHLPARRRSPWQPCDSELLISCMFFLTLNLDLQGHQSHGSVNKCVSFPSPSTHSHPAMFPFYSDLVYFPFLGESMYVSLRVLLVIWFLWGCYPLLYI